MSGSVRGNELTKRNANKPRDRLPTKLSKNATAAIFKAIHEDNYCDYLPEGLSAAFFQKALEDGADPNGCSRGISLFEHLMSNPAIFGDGDHNEVETRKTFELLISHGMRLQKPTHLAELLVWVSGLPDQVREFARKQKLLRATEEETRLEVLRFRLTKGGLRVIPDDFFELAGPLAQKDRQFVELALKENGDTLSCASDAVRSDKNLVLVAVSSEFGNAIRHASAGLKDDPEVALAAISNPRIMSFNGPTKDALEYVSKRLRNDKSFVLATMRKCGQNLQYVSQTLRNDPDVIAAAVGESPWAMEFASSNIRNNKGIVKSLIENAGGTVLEFASQKLQKDPELQKLTQKLRR
jgi:hypothetical protein